MGETDGPDVNVASVARHGNRLNGSSGFPQDSFEIVWVPSGEFAAGFEAFFAGRGPQEVHGHVADDGHVLGTVAGAEAGEVLAEVTSRTQWRRFSICQ